MRGMYLVNPAADGTKTTKRAAMESVRVLKRLVDRSRGDRTLLSMTLREGQNREIRRMLARVGLKLRELERVAIGPLRAGRLKPGATKLLGKKDVEKLRGATLLGWAESEAQLPAAIVGLQDSAQPTMPTRFSSGRTNPSCATDATSRRSRPKICARVKPRAPPANGLIASTSIHSSARHGR